MINVKDIENLAQLARIRLTDGEKSSLVSEIDAILAYVDQIKEASVALDHTPTPGALKNIARSDDARTISPRDRELILNEAPDREGDFVAVKKIIA